MIKIIVVMIKWYKY